MIKKTAGRWDPDDWPLYFVATNPEQLSIANHDRLLLAVNEIENEQSRKILLKLVSKEGTSLFIDSGVFNLSTEHAKKHKVTMDVALSLGPEEIDGFQELFDRYVGIVKEVGDESWGYIEIDQGGRDNKIKTRAKLEKLGLRPVPVYHPINDGWDYFDELAEQYDRICFGNVVNADIATRKRLVATAWERRRKYPHLWIHLLGLTPSELLTAYPMNSCDSSTWIARLRWAQNRTHVANQAFGDLGLEFTYDYESNAGWDREQSDPTWNVSYVKGLKLCGYEAGMMRRTMVNIAREQRDVLGADIGLFK